MIYLHIPINFVYCSMININTKRKDVKMSYSFDMRKPKDRAIIWNSIRNRNRFTMDYKIGVDDEGCTCMCHNPKRETLSKSDWGKI
jgi:hypothetical protein